LQDLESLEHSLSTVDGQYARTQSVFGEDYRLENLLFRNNQKQNKHVITNVCIMFLGLRARNKDDNNNNNNNNNNTATMAQRTTTKTTAIMFHIQTTRQDYKLSLLFDWGPGLTSQARARLLHTPV